MFSCLRSAPSPRYLSLRLLGGESLESRRLLAFDPTPLEQEMFEHINRMRMDPQGELSVLFESLSPTLDARDLFVQAAVDFFEVDAATLQTQWSELVAVSPLAWASELHDAADGHNDLIIEYDLQSHQLPGELPFDQRISAAGYNWNAVGENVFAYAETALYGHAGFAIDWGLNPPSGIQDPPGHRENIMSTSFREVGIAVTEESDDLTDVGPLVVTQDFGRRSNFQPQLLGVVWEDGFDNGYFEAGEGYSGFTITIIGDTQTYTTETLRAGGYQIAVPPGTYEVRAHNSFLGTFAWGNVQMNSNNVKVDFELSTANTPPFAGVDNLSAGLGTTELNVLQNDVDLDGTLDVTSLVIVDGPTVGTVEVDPVTGIVRYTHQDCTATTDTFTYRVWDDNQTSVESQVTLTLTHDTSSLLPGDANADGSVDGTDFGIWQEHAFTPNATWCQADFNGDAIVDGADFNIWNAHKFTSQPLSPAAADRVHASPRAPLAEPAATVDGRPAETQSQLADVRTILPATVWERPATQRLATSQSSNRSTAIDPEWSLSRSALDRVFATMGRRDLSSELRRTATPRT
ncbi:MAG: hypothetical protein KDA60_11670 [Planctomycetales bacterium]|nr:hypothetical protein [Planctomycetales bacterium]